MIKRISVTQLSLGMHVHELCGSWMEHPFWRSKFTLRKRVDLDRIVGLGVTELWIDTDKGLDVDGGADPEAADATAGPEPVSRATAAAARDLADPMALQAQRAASIVRRAVPQVAEMFRQARLGRVVEVADCVSIVDEISASVMRNPGAIISVARLKERDAYTYMHSVAVCALMVSLGHQLGLQGESIRTAGLAGLLHDIGKISVPTEILNKPGRLTVAEFDLMKTHPERGHDLLAGSHVGTDVLDVCMHHHEKVDGGGYPHGLRGDDISLLAKMGAVCDVYDAVTSIRPYNDGWDPAEALRRMAQWTGHFDAAIFQAFVKTVGIYPVGSLVRLQSGRLAVVTAQNPGSLLAPRVKVFFSTKADLRLDPYEVDLSGRRCQDKVVACESPDRWNFTGLDELQRTA